MKKCLMVLGLVVLLVHPVLAWRPSGWVYSNYPYAYDSESGDWYWFNTADTQWVVNLDRGQWSVLSESALASGWFFYSTWYAYSGVDQNWYYINELDEQWVVNLRTGTWSQFGSTPAPPPPGS
jgi:hypothetical protein